MKILLIRLSSIGDIILTEPVIRKLKQIYPHCEVSYLTKKQFVPLLERFENISEIIPFHNYRQTIPDLKSRKFDLIIDLHSKLRTFVIRMLINAPHKVVYSKHHLRRYLLVKKIHKKPVESTVLLYFNVFRKLRIDKDPTDHYPQLISGKPTGPCIDELGTAINDPGKKLIALFPGATHPTKCYPLDYLSVVIDELSSERDCRVVLFGSAGEKGIVNRLIKLCSSEPLNWCGRFDLAELIDVIYLFDIVITNDSGPMHMAAALKKKQVALFGATHPILGFKPHNDNAVVLQTELSCRPCSLHGGKECPRKHFLCMKSIKPEMLKQAVLKMW